MMYSHAHNLSMRDDRIYLRHMLDATEKALKYRSTMSFEDFVQDEMRVDAVIRELMIVGEAAAHLSENFRISHPEIPFPDIIGMRNRLIHEYFGIDTEAVSKTCEEDLPALTDFLREALKN